MTAVNLIAALEPLTSRVRTDVTAIKGPQGMAWTREALTEVRLKRHLDGSLPRGVCPIKAGESTTRVALFDLDSHKGEVLWPAMVELAVMVIAIAGPGWHFQAFRSSGGKGIHLIAIWDEPQDAYSVRQAMRSILERMDFKDGAKGVAQNEIEVFPKQDSVPEHGFGNQFILPLAGKSAPLEPLADYEVMPREYALQLDWRASAPVPVVEKQVRELVKVEYSPSQLSAALDAIPNDTDPLGYDEWRDIISGIHHATGGSDEGYQLAYEFSARAPHFDQDELDLKVWAWLDNKGHSSNPITERTILAKAREHGWQDIASVEDFEDLTPVVQEAGEKIDLPLPAFQRDGNGKIEPVVLNLRAAMVRPDVCRMDVRFDEFKGEVVFAHDGQPDQWQTFQDHHYFDLRCQLETIGFKPIGREAIRDAVHHRARNATIDTAIRWLDSLKWDGAPRIDDFFHRYFGTVDSPYTKAVSRYTWSALAGRILVPGVKADMVPILTGSQGQRKSSGLEALGPFDSFRAMSFDQSDDARARLMRGCLVVELAELNGLKTRAVEEIKAWIARRKEDWVPKYQEYAVSLLRRCLFFGTSNPKDVLDDPTGERRWLPMDAGDVDVEGILRDREQLWAEGKVLFERGGVAWRDAERLAKAVHADYRVVDTWEDQLRTWLRTPGLDEELPADTPFKTRDALVDGLGFADRNIKRGDEMRVAKALKSLGYVQSFTSEGGKTVRAWVSTTSHNLC